MKMQVKMEWWNVQNRQAAIDESHTDALLEAGVQRAAEMIAEGYTSGELHESVCMDDSDPDGIQYQGYWQLDRDTEVSMPEGWEIVPVDLVTHLHDWKQACQIQIENIEAGDAMEFQDIRSLWESRIYLLNGVMWKLQRAKVMEFPDVPAGWAAAPCELRAKLDKWEEACRTAVANTSPNLETQEDDRAYWQKQVRVIERIKEQLGIEPEQQGKPWYSAKTHQPSIPVNAICHDQPVLAKRSDGTVLPAYLYGGRPLPDEGSWLIDAEGRKERHWVAVESSASGATNRIIPDVVEWMFMPGNEFGFVERRT